MIYQEAKRRYASEGVAQPAACPECGNDLMNVWGMNQGTLGRAWKCDKCGHQWKYYSDRELAAALLAMVEWLSGACVMFGGMGGDFWVEKAEEESCTTQ